MNVPDSMLERLRKIKALVDHGCIGEAHNATRLLSQLLVKHGLTIDDLQVSDAREYTFTWRDNDDRQLLIPLIRQIAGAHHPLFRIVGKRKSVIARLTPVQFADIIAMHDHYRHELRQERQRLLRVFIIRHHIGPPPSTTDVNSAPLTESQQAEITGLRAMMMSLRSAQFQTTARLAHASAPMAHHDPPSLVVNSTEGLRADSR